MNGFAFLALFVALIGLSSAAKQCSGHNCASTTNYADYHKGACGCGPANGDNQFGWNHDHYVVAANQHFFDTHGAGWCGGACGKCIRLTPTGGYVEGQGGPPSNRNSHVFMVTNLCPAVSPNLAWCAQTNQHPTNTHGYEAHFDLENGNGQISKLGWNNPEVTWEFTSCNNHESLTPNDGLFHNCQCAHQGK